MTQPRPVVSNFKVQALSGEALTVYGDDSRTRSFCNADDMIDGFIRLVEAPGDPGGPVNVGNSHEVSMPGVGRVANSRAL